MLFRSTENMRQKTKHSVNSAEATIANKNLHPREIALRYTDQNSLAFLRIMLLDEGISAASTNDPIIANTT